MEYQEMTAKLSIYPIAMVEIGGPQDRNFTEYYLKVEINGVVKTLRGYKTEKLALKAMHATELSLKTTGELPNIKKKNKEKWQRNKQKK
jgi:hypothetical protein